MQLFLVGEIFGEVAVMLECNYLWHLQLLGKFWEIAGAQKVVFFHTKCAAESLWSKLALQTGGCKMTSSSSDHGRIMLRSC